MDQGYEALLPVWLLPSANVSLAACLKQPDKEEDFSFMQRKKWLHYQTSKMFLKCNQFALLRIYLTISGNSMFKMKEMGALPVFLSFRFT